MKSKRFEPIQEIAANSATALSRAMAEAEGKVRDMERQMEQLRSYRDEYARQSAQSAGSTDAVSLQNYRSFLDRLGDALRLQTQNLGLARAEYETRRAQWSAKRVEAESLSRAIARFRDEERRVDEQREQRDSDEAAMRLALGARGDSPGY
ncbi:MAG: flagellar export protein FliJ [Steroidobacteraceae bacterium]|nr:flagellar export protein FliJ [Steroidobacteraceae bacterium]